MSTKWTISIIAAAVIVCLGTGFGLGYIVWGQRTGDGISGTVEQLERELADSRGLLSSARATIDELDRRERETADALAESKRYNQELEGQNRAITEAVSEQAGQLSEAVEGSRTITEIIRAVRESIDQYARTVEEARPP